MENQQRLPVLDDRLSAVASLVRGGVTCADIGTDHGYLITWLAATGAIPRGLACDINEKPLEHAAATIQDYGMQERVRTLHTDGLSDVPPEDAQEIVIAGMGGEMIARILSAAPWCQRMGAHFVLQPMTRIGGLREYLCENGYAILREKAAQVGKFSYTVLSVEYTGNHSICDKLFREVGLLPRETSPQARAYLMHRATVLEQIAHSMRRSPEKREQAQQQTAIAWEIRRLAQRIPVNCEEQPET